MRERESKLRIFSKHLRTERARAFEQLRRDIRATATQDIPERFCSFFQRGHTLLNLDEERAAELFGTGIPTVRRWLGGMRPPGSVIILRWLLQEISKSILFLDIDGVLNSHIFRSKVGRAYWKESELLTMLDPVCCRRLGRLLQDTGASVVLSATCRVRETCESMQTALAMHGCLANVIDRTPVHNDRWRGREIQEWLDGHPEVDRFVILDDESRDIEHLGAHLTKVTPFIGLSERDCDRARALFRGSR